MALALDAGQSFAIDKPAGLACPNLTGHACRIHGQLKEQGFDGCRAYECLGAGQRVTQDLFQGRSWQDDPRLTDPMIRAFAGMRAIHQRLELLQAAGALPLDTADRNKRRASIDTLSGTLPLARVESFPGSAEEAEVDAFIRSLSRYVARE
ncbi:hypothetical protein [Pseudooceanicola algae]|nr:hypothetical protein [Pseudooceanicola algae]